MATFNSLLRFPGQACPLSWDDGPTPVFNTAGDFDLATLMGFLWLFKEVQLTWDISWRLIDSAGYYTEFTTSGSYTYTPPSKPPENRVCGWAYGSAEVPYILVNGGGYTYNSTDYNPDDSVRSSVDRDLYLLFKFDNFALTVFSGGTSDRYRIGLTFTENTEYESKVQFLSEAEWSSVYGSNWRYLKIFAGTIQVLGQAIPVVFHWYNRYSTPGLSVSCSAFALDYSVIASW